mgnify:CR=1 FL=1
MSKPIFQLLYLSSARKELNEEALLKLLAESQSRNAKRNITGLLLHSDGNIIQIIEGSEKDVDELFGKIANDSRHSGVTLLSRRKVETRDFPEYKMGFRRTQPETIEASIPGFSNLVDQGVIPAAELEGLSVLVSVFLKTFARSTGMRTE